MYIYRGKELSVDAINDPEWCTYEITGLKSGSTYYCAMQSSDITKGCEEHVSPLSAAIEIQTVAVQESDDETRLPLVIDNSKYGQPTPIIYLSEPALGAVLNVYDVNGVLIYSLPVYNAVSEYVIPTANLRPGTLYVVKYVTDGKMKRKQGWAKFML